MNRSAKHKNKHEIFSKDRPHGNRKKNVDIDKSNVTRNTTGTKACLSSLCVHRIDLIYIWFYLDVIVAYSTINNKR